tara:strand:- start:28 stop:306 length:279 start_codon:yes stop_codon:yes gene_type:complete
MMTISKALNTLKDGESDLIHQIARRAKTLVPAIDILATSMDLTIVHAATPLRLDDMLADSGANLLHDVCGIATHLDRMTGTLQDYFTPRFTA